jgi:thiol-disulfide isomerase/thioredoxin
MGRLWSGGLPNQPKMGRLYGRGLPSAHPIFSTEHRNIQMSVLRRMVGPSILLVVAAVAVNGWSQEAGVGDDPARPASPAADPYAVPAGDAATLLSFIEGLANPKENFENQDEAQEYLDRASTAISTAADKVLAGQATDKQASEAVQWKIESLRIREMLGEQDASEHRDAFLDQVVKDPRRAVAGMAAVLRLITRLSPGHWSRLGDAQRAEVIDQFVADVKATGPTTAQAELLVELCDVLSDTRDSKLALQAISALSPTLASSTDPDIRKFTLVLEATARRINLPGSKIELEGTLMDGSRLNWESYRGKVVLVDFWASWCGPCRGEVPNVLANYKAYHDKGFEVLGICLDDDRSAAEQYIKESGIIWPSLYGEGPEQRGWNHPMAEKYAVNGVPRAILVDQDGRVVDSVSENGIQAGMMARGPLLGQQLRRLLGEPGPAVGPTGQAGVGDDPARSGAAAATP